MSKQQFNLDQAKAILQLTKNKSRAVSFNFNPTLWEKFKDTAKNNGQTASSIVEEFIIEYLIKNKAL